MALLGMIQDVCDDIGLNRPVQIVGSTDAQIKQMLQIANREGRSLAARTQWKSMVRENTFTLALSKNQGVVNGTVVTDSDFDYPINETMWNRTTTLPILGPLDAREYQTLQAFPVTGPYQQFRFQGGHLYIDPIPTSADTVAFEYMSTSWCESSGGTGQSEWLDDTDVGLLDEELMKLGITWRWYQRKGLEYQEDYMEYERRVINAIGREGGAPIKRLDSHDRDYRQAGIVIPIGSWTP